LADPVVPDAPGVPPLVRAEPAPPEPTLQTGDTLNTVGATSTPQWGLFKDGEPVVFADSVVALEYKQDWDLLDYPIEGGAFETYNKVLTPFEVRVRFASGGSWNNRGALLSDIAYLAQTFDLYDVVTPEVTLSNCNIEHWDYKRSSDSGVGLIVVFVHLRQIRVTVNPEFSHTEAPSGADAVFAGSVQTSVATNQQMSDIFSQFNDAKAPSLPGSVQPVWPNTDPSLFTMFPQNGAGF
jgi:hypothetical protein